MCNGTGDVSTWREEQLVWALHSATLDYPRTGRSLGNATTGVGTDWQPPSPSDAIDEFVAPRANEARRELTVTAHPIASVQYPGPDGPETLWIGGSDGVVDAPDIEARLAARRHHKRVVLSVVIAAAVIAAVITYALTIGF
jgi:hypothetical protein